MSAQHAAHAQADTVAALGGYLTALAESHGQEEVVQTLCETAARLLPRSSGKLWQLALDREGWYQSGGWQAGVVLPPQERSLRTTLPRGPTDELRLPLQAHGLTVAELRIPCPEIESEAEQELLRSLATAAAISLSGHVLKRRVRHRNVRDPLTGLFNRRYLEDTLERELHRARRVNAGLVLIRLEVDTLEAFAAEHGSETADRLLQVMADAVHHAFRGSDVCCRAGDNGFGILLPDASLDNGAMRAEAVREELAELRIHQRGRPLGPVTVSAGVAAYPDHGSNRDLLLEAAESAVTCALDEGGDLLRVAELIAPPNANQN
ncbi:GGDEF domain-containing protein [Halorhodospira halophila]|uniref:GGDEF domain-containing protein n=1 Tax=Halorhodospira halophila TaxID=1053 RepID=UPI001911EBA6|nr:GGDEF domain-containing protein [Halorhodospira halophila]MBK5942792.1 hypothetical protein [Halorhodospira halophila]